ncbi:helix-turn-helix transcriptional regulator [Gluconacetobacter diazotrophicus]|uniref:Helix-turn-helix transcriptional regulator n=1 Tax=Gluconacetobacter diazotrophicus TaxID=33996 RepID=A0A7W4I6P0_GLUDI|nr:helix-turn-helix transcriptional regulator [Gluconacetobacter diazotrophicus]MBB2157236.1 helix-turn-helix transcriptional regulator [Gluconacetobacter diazotrophicus]
MSKQRYAWVEDESRDEMSLILDGRRAGALIPWKDKGGDQPTGWTCVMVRDDGSDHELMPPDAFWTPLATAQRFLLDAVGLSPVEEPPADNPPMRSIHLMPKGRDVALTRTIAAILRREREKCGMSRADLALAVGVRTDLVRDWEAGAMQPRLVRLLDALSVLGALPSAMDEILAEDAKIWGVQA